MGMTQEQVAGHGISYRYYQELERGERNPTLRTLHLLARILHPSLEALVDPRSGAGAGAYLRLADVTARPPKRGRKPKALPGLPGKARSRRTHGKSGKSPG